MNRFVKGLVIGSGFAAGVVLVAVVGVLLLTVLPIHLDSPHSIVGTGAIEIVSHRLEFDYGKPTVLGRIRNTTKTDLRSVIIQASLFDVSGNFIDKQIEYVRHLPPNDAFGFKIYFHDWDPDEAVTNVKCKVLITQGYDRE